MTHLFNAEARCPKCGGENILGRYHRGPADCNNVAEQLGYIIQPHMYRCCQRCGYDWRESPLDEVGQDGG